MSHDDPDTAAAAEASFYAAFENGDIDAMAALWERSGDVVCVHPRGPQLLGYEQVMESWRDILAHIGGFRLTVQVIQDHTDRDTSVRFVNETLFNENDPTRPVTVLATNAYRRTDSGWRMVLHHASPPPDAVEEPDESPDNDDEGGGVTLH